TCTVAFLTGPVPASIIPARHHIIPDPLGPRTPNEGKAHDDRLPPERGTPFLAAPASEGGRRRGRRARGGRLPRGAAGSDPDQVAHPDGVGRGNGGVHRLPEDMGEGEEDYP